MVLNVNYDVRQYTPKAPSLIDSHISWLRQERDSLLERIGIVVLIALETFVLSLTLIGIPFVIHAFNRAHSMAAYERFNHEALSKVPPSKEPIEFKTKTESFNHIHDFAISDDTLWFRKRNSQDGWTPIYFDGFESGKTPKEVSCDGCNLIVLDEDNNVHYKKVLKERRELIEGQTDRERELRGHYTCIDKAINNNWKENWFSLPYGYAYFFINLFTGKRLHVPEDSRGVSISQKGRLASYWNDFKGREIRGGTGVTSLHVLSSDGKEVTMYDPWVPTFMVLKDHLPESETKTFTANVFATSASTALFMGYEQEKDNPLKTLKIYTQVCDLDYRGVNPVNRYTYDINETDPDTQILPGESVIEHPLHLQRGDAVSSKITIFQTGEGDGARELRIEGVGQGHYGYFYKNLTDHEFSFRSLDNGKTLTAEDFIPEYIRATEPFTTSTHSYEGQIGNIHAKLEHFGAASTQATLTLQTDDETTTLPLYHRQRGFSCLDKDELVQEQPRRSINNPELAALVERIFHGDLVRELSIKSNDDGTLNLHPQLPALRLL